MSMFPILDFDQVNPGLTGAKRITDIFDSILKNQSQAITNRFAPRNLAEALREKQLANDLAQGTLQPNIEAGQMLPQKTMADIFNTQNEGRLKRAQADWLPRTSQANIAKIMQGDIPESQATANYKNQEAKFLPLKNLIDAQSAIGKSSRFGKAYEFSRLLSGMSQQDRSQWIADNREQYNQLLSDLGNKNLEEQEGKGNTALSEQISKLFPEFVNKNQQQQSQIQQMPQQVQQPINALNPQTVVNNLQENIKQFGVNKEQAELQQDIQRMGVNRKLVSAQTNKRADSAVAMDKWLTDNREEYGRRLRNAAEYAGAKGRGAKFADEWKNAHPNDTADYDWVKDVFKPHMANQIKMMEGLSSSNGQRKEMHGMIENIDNMKSNPQRALTGINRGIQTLYDISDSLFDAAEPANKGIYRKLAGLHKHEGNYTDIKEKQKNVEGLQARKTINGKTYEMVNGELWEVD